MSHDTAPEIRRAQQEADNLEAFIAALLSRIGLPTEEVSYLRSATPDEIAHASRFIASIICGKPTVITVH